jgi:hypothetical protein
MVFCRECRKKVVDCQHFVRELAVQHVAVFDPKVASVAYDEQLRILEIRFKNGQTWQLRPMPPDIYAVLLDQTISSFLKFVAHRYHANPVRTGEAIPTSEPCPACKRPMSIAHQTGGDTKRVLWHCTPCNQSQWKTYGSDTVRERKTRWH